MPEGKHTPSPTPWKRNTIVESDFASELHEVNIYDANGDQCGVAYGRSADEALANADLFASGPDTLEALEAVLHLQEMYRIMPHDIVLRKTLFELCDEKLKPLLDHAAIAKAEPG